MTAVNPNTFQLSERQSRLFWAKVEKSAGCWLWMAARRKNGYGKFGRFGYESLARRGTPLLAHRVSFAVAHGFMPQMVCHTCDNPPCVNPAHLYAGTKVSNGRDAVERGQHFLAKRTHCKNGHPFTAENTRLVTREGSNRRRCLACQRLASRRCEDRKRDARRAVRAVRSAAAAL